MQAALAEMVRVARPGALIAVVEPNNGASALMLDSSLRGAPTQEIVDLVELQLVAERGKAALGLGDNSVGEQLPTTFRALGLDDVRVYLSDCANPVLPPYDDPASRAIVAEMLDWSKRDFWIWDEQETGRYFVAGGGTAEAFGGYWRTAAGARQRQAHAIAAHQYDSAGGGLTYLVSGRKPCR
jgi:hypothetical protein